MGTTIDDIKQIDDVQEFMDTASKFISDGQFRLTININALHKECLNQANFAWMAATLASEVRYRVKNTKMNLDTLKAKTNLDIRANPADYDIDKVTEGSINACVLTDEDVIMVQTTLLKLETLLENVIALANAYEHKRSMLKIESELYGNEYWSTTPVEIHPSTESVKDRESKIVEKRKKSKTEITE